MITQSEYWKFRKSVNTLIREYREKFSVPAITYSRKYEEAYRKRLLGMSMYMGFTIDHASEIMVNEFGGPSLLDSNEKTSIQLTRESMRLNN